MDCFANVFIRFMELTCIVYNKRIATGGIDICYGPRIVVSGSFLVPL
jgi:hypothetical protein